MEQAGSVKAMNSEEGGGGAGDEDAELVEEGVEGIEGAVVGKW